MANTRNVHIVDQQVGNMFVQIVSVSDGSVISLEENW